MATLDPINEDFRKERRNLIVVSFILCLMNYGGIKITKTTTLVGVEIEFFNPSVIFLGLWLLWIYFGIRCYQYLMEEGNKRIWLLLYNIMTERSKTKIESIVREKYPKIYTRGNAQTFDYNILVLNMTWKSLIFSGREDKGQDGMGGYHIEAFQMEIGKWRLWKQYLTSWLSILINHTVIMDYVFPIAFAIFTLIYCNTANWQGSIIRIIQSPIVGLTK